jgi:dihydroorotate dehydrogenase subfamily 2
MSKRNYLYIILALAIVGVIDAGYLSWEHYANVIPPCSTNIFIDCGAVLRSKYSIVFGIPLAVYGLLYYIILSVVGLYTLLTSKRIGKYLIVIFSTIGLLVSTYLMYLQLFVIGSICLYCTGSALISFVLFLLVQMSFVQERKRLFVLISWYFYKFIFKKVLFLIESETIHNVVVDIGESLGKLGIVGSVGKTLLVENDRKLRQKLVGIDFENPIGLAAGFDYEARLTQFLPSIGFGFTSVGTITNMPYEGNPKPRLGRLTKSKSLMVNKGFKSTGAKVVSKRLSRLKFDIPVGISIGRTNSVKLTTQEESVKDIILAFKTFEKVKLNGVYYELNISCPNLINGDISFYSPRDLKELLTAVDKIKVKKPIFVKMPIETSDKETLGMLGIIAEHKIAGVIFGNLQKDRKHSTLDKNEVKKFAGGYFSGKPTYDRSNELISLAYKHYKNRFLIIGCGGVFGGKDAYEKISRGASLVQLITGLIYEGPQLVQQINFELLDILEEKGYKNISEAVGSSSN